MNILDFANPVGWWWAALALPIIGFYILKVRLRRQPVSTLLFWDRVFDEKKPRAWWQQLRHWLSLFLQLALLGLLVAAIVDPLWSWQKSQQRKLVLVIDNSASMAAQQQGETRLEQAKKTAAAFVRSLRAGDEMAILTAGGKSSVAIGLTDHARSLLEALNAIVATDAPSALESAVATAKRLIPESEQSQIIVLTDGCDPTVESLQNDPLVTLYGFGSAKANLAITQFQVRRSLLDAIGYQVLVEVSNLSDEAKKCRVEMSLEDELVDVVPIELEAGGSKIFNLDQTSAAGGRFVATLDGDDEFTVDNRAIAVLPTSRKIPVTLVNPGSLFLKSVLSSIPLVDLELQSDAPEKGKLDGIVVLHQSVPEMLPAGKLLIISPRNSCDLFQVGEAIDTPIVGKVDSGSPITQHVKMENVLFPEARAITFSGETETLIATPFEDALLSYLRRPNGDVLVLNVNLDQGDLPLRIAFPVLMKNAIEWFQGNQGELIPALSTGTPSRIPLPRVALEAPADTLSQPQGKSKETGTPSSTDIEVVSNLKDEQVTNEFHLRSPAGIMTPIARTELSAATATLLECGLWMIGKQEDLANDPWVGNAQPSENEEDDSTEFVDRVANMDDRVVHIAANLCNRNESDLRPRVELAMPVDMSMLSIGGRSIWFYLVFAALVLAAIEWWLYQRRVVG